LTREGRVARVRFGSHHRDCRIRDGVILLDDEHADGARITIERGGKIAPFATENEARRECTEMMAALATLLDKVSQDPDRQETGMIFADFVERFP